MRIGAIWILLQLLPQQWYAPHYLNPFTLNPYDLILPDYVTYNRSITKAFFCYRISKHEWVKLSFPLLVMRTCYIAQRLVYTTGPSAVLPLIWYTQLFLYRVNWMTK